jgi:O-6-methylguanine DNA methyltransferase
MLEYRVFHTKWGHAAIVGSGQGLRATFLPHADKTRTQRQVQRRYPDAKPNPRLMPAVVRAIQGHFEGKTVRFDVRLDLEDLTEFRRRVLQACCKIPRGKTASYADLARAAGSAEASRAVGSTMANNPLPLVVPCHRVIRSDGSLGKFSSPGGPQLKRRMLQLEGALPA